MTAMDELESLMSKASTKNVPLEHVKQLYQELRRFHTEIDDITLDELITRYKYFEITIERLLDKPDIRGHEKKMILASFNKALDKIETRLSKPTSPRKSRRNAINLVTSRSRSHNMEKSRRNHLLNVYRHGTPLITMDKQVMNRLRKMLSHSKVYNKTSSQKNRSNRRP